MKAAEGRRRASKLEPNMANVLGTDYVTVMDMATAYATIAAEGVRADPYIVREVRFLDESVPTIKAEKVTKRVFKKDLMSDVIDAMTYPVEGGTGPLRRREPRPPGRRQDRHLGELPVGLVRRLRAAAAGRRRAVPQREGRRGARHGEPADAR